MKVVRKVVAFVLIAVFRVAPEKARPELRTWTVGDILTFEWTFPIWRPRFEGISTRGRILTSERGEWSEHRAWRGKNITIVQRQLDARFSQSQRQIQSSVRREDPLPRPPEWDKVSDRSNYEAGQWIN